MKLSKVVEDIGKDTLIYLSAGTSFVFIGTKDRFIEDIYSIDRMYVDMYKRRIETAKYWLDNMPSNIEKYNRFLKCKRAEHVAITEKLKSKKVKDKKKLRDMKKELEHRIKELELRLDRMPQYEESNKNTVKKLTAYLKKWVNMIDREVIDMYDRTVYYGVGHFPEKKIIKITGDEAGRYWFDYEYDNDIERRKQ